MKHFTILDRYSDGALVSPERLNTVACAGCGKPTFENKLTWVGRFATCPRCSRIAAGLDRENMQENDSHEQHA